VSYARFSADSDVYVYHDYMHHLCCCACRLAVHYSTQSTAEMLSHLGDHVLAGHRVPEDCITALRDEGERCCE